MDEYCTYIDESGTPDFSEKAIDFYCVCAVVIRKSDVEVVSEAISIFAKKNNLPELKSSSIGDGAKRRSYILSELSKHPISVFTIFVDKRKLEGVWCTFRPTFYIAV